MYLKASEVKERIKLYFHGLIDAGIKEVDAVDCAAELQKLIDKVPGIGWISVKDALPEVGKSVPVFINGRIGNITFQNSVEIGAYYPDGWFLEAYTHNESLKVYHWMELPDGPENGEGTI